MASTSQPKPEYTYDGKHVYKKEPVPDQFVDSVFNVIMTDPVTLPCHHRFNKMQITRWVANKDHTNCPLCKGAGSPVTDDSATRQAVSKWLISKNFSDVAFGHPEGIDI